MIALIAVESVVLLVLCILVAGLLRSYAVVLQRLHRLDGGDDARAGTGAPPFRTAPGVVAPPDGAVIGGAASSDAVPTAAGAPGKPEWGPAHDVSGDGLTGEVVSVRTVGVHHDTVLVFLSSGCAGCTGFWEQFADGRGFAAVGDSRVLVVTKDPQEESVSLLRSLASPGLDVVMSTAAWTDFGVPGSPYVVVVDGPSGRVKGEGSGTSLSQISGLMQQAYGDGAASPGRRRVNKPRADVEREVDVDRTLLAAGIGPGHPSLYAAESLDVPAMDTSRVPPEHRLDLVDAITTRDSAGSGAPGPGGAR